MPDKTRRRPPPKAPPLPPPVRRRGQEPPEDESNQVLVDEMRDRKRIGGPSWMKDYLEPEEVEPIPGQPDPGATEKKTSGKGLLWYLNPLNWFKSQKEAEAKPEPPEPDIDPKDLKHRKKLGKGSFGMVYQSTLRGEDVATKFPLSQIDPNQRMAAADQQKANEAEDDEKMKASIEDEIVKMKMLPEHENIMGLKGRTTRKGTDEKDIPGLVMEYAPYGDLDKLYQKARDPERAKPDNEDLRFRLTTRDAIRGLREIHKRGLVHGDVKGGNIMLGKGYKSKIGDFGSLHRQGEGKEGSIGTDPFSAPENLENKPTQKSDMWAMGETLLQGLTGQTSGEMMGGVPSADEKGFTKKKATNKDFFSKTLPGLLQKKKVDPRAIDLIQGLLEVDTVERLSSKEALEADYLKLTPEEEEEARLQLFKTTHDVPIPPAPEYNPIPKAPPLPPPGYRARRQQQ